MWQHKQGAVKFFSIFVGNFLRFSSLQEFWKSVKIWQSYCHRCGAPFFETQCSLRSLKARSPFTCAITVGVLEATCLISRAVMCMGCYCPFGLGLGLGSCSSCWINGRPTSLNYNKFRLCSSKQCTWNIEIQDLYWYSLPVCTLWPTL